MAECAAAPTSRKPFAWARGAVLVGRAYAYGLGAAGHAGVVRALEILRDDFERVLRLMGCASVAELNPSLLDVPEAWRAKSPARESEPARKQ